MFKIDVPDVIGSANVICYAVVNLCLPTYNTQHYANGELLGVAYGLVICKYENDDGCYLFYCDDQWVEFADTWHETTDDAKDQAEYEYAGITNNWSFK
ncbi:MAG TPA: hypothetical protein VGN20_19440 [Mucilaginibacter sp.]|jgi:hypothetical protein